MTITTIRNPHGLETVRDYWQIWQNHPNIDFAHFQLVCGLREEVECPYVTVLEHEGKPYGLLAARLERTYFRLSIAYLNLVQIPSKILTVVYEGLLGDVNEETAQILTQHLLSSLASGEADAVAFHQIAEDSPLYKALMMREPRLLSGKGNAWSTHREMVLCKEPGFQLKKLQSKHRSWIRGREKKLASTFSGKVCWRWVKNFDDIPKLCSQLEEVAAHTYQRGLGVGFRNDEEHRQRFALFAGRGQLRIQLLEIEGKIRAFWIGQVYRNIFHSEATGYDMELSEYEPGTLVLMHMIDELVKEEVLKLDFGLGDALYKQRFGDRSWREKTITVFAPTAKGLFLWFGLGICAVLDRLGRHMAQKTGLLDRVKTIWRQRLAPARSEADEK